MYIVGHRGAKGLAPENTLAAFQKALEFNVDEIETDVRLTKDGRLALVHDRTLKRLTGKKLAIADHTYAELQAVKPDIATLEEAIRLIDKRIPLRIEVKPGVPVEPVVTMINDFLSHGWQNSNFLLASFSHKTLLELHRALPDIEKAVIERFSGVRATHRARQVNTKRLVMNQHFVWFGFVRAISRSGYELTPYVLNNPAKAKRWARYGLYGVVTDFPDKMQTALDD